MIPAQLPNSSGASALGLCRYEVVEELASGGMATVYLARCRGVAGFERAVAIKRLHPHLSRQRHFVDMFLDEARIAARIHHSNVVSTLDIGGDEESGYFLVMEYVAGRPLGAVLHAARESGRRLGPRVLLRIALDALAGIAAAHALTDHQGRPLGLVHRDISPNNLLVGADGVTRVTDFGVALAAGRIASTEPGVVKGKLGYMSPEQAAGCKVDARSDVFSMGVVLWEALTHRRLFQGSEPALILQKVARAEVPPPSTIDPALAPFDPIIARALAREPDDRFASAIAFSEALEATTAVLGQPLPARAVARALAVLVGETIESERSRARNAVAVGVERAFATSSAPPSEPVAAQQNTGRRQGGFQRAARTRPVRKRSARELEASQPPAPQARATPAPPRGRSEWQLRALALTLVLLAGSSPPSLHSAAADRGAAPQEEFNTVVLVPPLTVIGERIAQAERGAGQEAEEVALSARADDLDEPNESSAPASPLAPSQAQGRATAEEPLQVLRPIVAGKTRRPSRNPYRKAQ